MKQSIAFFILGLLYFLTSGILIYAGIKLPNLNIVSRIGDFVIAGISAMLSVICFISAKANKG